MRSLSVSFLSTVFLHMSERKVVSDNDLNL